MKPLRYLGYGCALAALIATSTSCSLVGLAVGGATPHREDQGPHASRAVGAGPARGSEWKTGLLVGGVIDLVVVGVLVAYATSVESTPIPSTGGAVLIMQ